ncbi:hypothetical protein [Streptomyces gobitricini]|uniref:GerMN domain-containing protein n=1 Tax=Streptomyces gobitricini TaxID=68211 RepID=A0ABN3MPS4_9ACTN
MRRRQAVALSAPAALLLAGCGIPETDVVAAGGPATVQIVPYPSTSLFLFFRSPDGRLMPVTRFLDDAPETPDSPGVGTARTVSELFAGPLENERRVGLTDGLPDLPETPVRAAPHPDGGVEVMVPIDLNALDDLAIRQLVCTIAFTEDDGGRTPVRLRGADTALEPTFCDAHIGHDRLPRPAAVRGTGGPPEDRPAPGTVPDEGR